MKITTHWLKKQKACGEGVSWFKNQKETDGLAVVKKLMRENKLDWANWLIVRLMVYRDYVAYAIYSAEQVIDIYEKHYPHDDRPRGAIEAAKSCRRNYYAAYAANAAYAAAKAAAGAAAYAADATAYAAYAAAYAADNAAANAAYAAAKAAAGAAAYSADAARTVTKKKILEYGIKLLEKR